jgi:cysteine desulfurase
MSQDFVYLDHAATTPVRPEVRAAMEPYLSAEAFGNPSSAHRAGQRARAALDEARRRIAAAVGAKPGEVVFTSGGTEADNLAVIGGALSARGAGRPFRVAVGATEHKAVLDAAHAVEAMGGEAMFLPTDADGRVDSAAVDEALRWGVAILSVMWVNNETGVMQDVARLAQAAVRAGAVFHTDAVQAVGKVRCRVDGTPIALISLSGHKLGAPKGIGALVVREGTALAPLLHGGGQQKGLRPGTENVPGAVALGRAVELAAAELDRSTGQMTSLRDRLERELTARVPDSRVNARAAARAPHVASIAFRGADAGALVVQLDLSGIACSAGSACLTGAAEPSHVLRAMRLADDDARGTLRFSLSPSTSEAEIDRAIQLIPSMVERTRRPTGVR